MNEEVAVPRPDTETDQQLGKSHPSHAITPVDAMIDTAKNPPPAAPKKKKAQPEVPIHQQNKGESTIPTKLQNQFHLDDEKCNENSDDEIENTCEDDYANKLKNAAKAPIRHRLKRVDGQLDLQQRSKREREQNADNTESVVIGEEIDDNQQNVNETTTAVYSPFKLSCF